MVGNSKTKKIATIVKTTCKTKKEAKNISKVLLDNKLAACIQIEKIDSLYIWEDKLCEDKEYLLNIKTKKELFQIVKEKIIKNHSYKVPQIIEIEISGISEDYLKYIEENSVKFEEKAKKMKKAKKPLTKGK